MGVELRGGYSGRGGGGVGGEHSGCRGVDRGCFSFREG